MPEFSRTHLLHLGIACRMLAFDQKLLVQNQKLTPAHVLQLVEHERLKADALGFGSREQLKPKHNAGIYQPGDFASLSWRCRAERTVWSNCSSLKGLLKKATAPACNARPLASLSS